MLVSHTLEEHIADWSPEPEAFTARLDCAAPEVLADILDSASAPPSEGDALPALWHWPYLSTRSGLIDLGEDGHPLRGALYPPIPRRRRMFVGGRLTVLRDLRVGWAATVESSVIGREIKRGRSGEMLFATVRRTYRQGDEICQIEEQDIMYRSGDATRRPSDPIATPLGEGAPWSSRPRPTTTKLFAFSAITANAHRIHYDLDYAQRVEGYPGLVVHGPLLILSMLELVRDNLSARSVSSLSYRLENPVICGDELLVEGEPRRDGVEDGVELVMRSSRHDAVASATVGLRSSE
jgi:3-methylfumaryl-CoA hydratase